MLNPHINIPIPLAPKSVSIVSSRAVYTDLLSIAFFLVGEECGIALVEDLRRDSGECIEYVVIRRGKHANLIAPPGGFIV